METAITEHKKPKSITTARVLRAQRELIEAIVEATRQSNLTRDRAQGKLSAIVADIWNEADYQINLIPLRESDDQI